MNKATVQYLRQLKHALKLRVSTRRHLLRKFHAPLEAFLEELPDPTMDALCAAFGTPEDMARILTADIPVAEHTRYRRQTRLMRIAAVTAAAFVLLFAVYTFWLKEIPMSSRDYAVVYTNEIPAKEILP